MLEYGAQANIKNIYSNYPENESNIPFIVENIKKHKVDIINILYESLIDKSLSFGMKILKKNEIVIGKKILRNKNLKGMTNIKDNWIFCWHGTKFDALESIMKHGLLAPGSKLESGVELEPQKNHIGSHQSMDNFDDWAKAIFVSPSILYALDPCYSQKIDSGGEKWSVLVEVKVRPNSYHQHVSTVSSYQSSKYDPKYIEYRIEKSENAIPTSIVFVRYSYIENNKDVLDITSLFKDFK